MYKTISLPQEAYKCNHYLEFYKLKQNKRLYYKDNIEIREGLEYYVYSETEKGYYKRFTTRFLLPENLYLDIYLGYVYIVYTLEDANEIKTNMKRKGIKRYKQYLKTMVGEYGHSRLKGNKRQEEAWQTLYNKFEELRSV